MPSLTFPRMIIHSESNTSLHAPLRFLVNIEQSVAVSNDNAFFWKSKTRHPQASCLFMHQNRSKVCETSNQFRNVVQLFERQLQGGPLTPLKNHTFRSSTQKLDVLIPEQYNKLVLCQLQRQLALRLRNKSVIRHLWLKIAQTPWHILKVDLWTIKSHQIFTSNSFLNSL